MSQFPPEETVGTSGDELPDRAPACRKEDFQLGRVWSLFPGPRGVFLESVATAAPSRDEVLSEGGRGPPGSAWLSSGTTSEPQPTVQGGPPWGAAGPSGALPLKSWLCLRIRTVIRCWTRDVPARKTERRPGCGRSRLGSGRCGWDPGARLSLKRGPTRAGHQPPSKPRPRQRGPAQECPPGTAAQRAPSSRCGRRRKRALCPVRRRGALLAGGAGSQNLCIRAAPCHRVLPRVRGPDHPRSRAQALAQAGDVSQVTWAPPPHTLIPVTFHDGHWVFYLWPKYIRSKNGCQVLDAHLVDIGVGLNFIQKPAGEEGAVGGEANPAPAVLGAAWRPHPATPTFPGPRAQPAAPARSERAELPRGPRVGAAEAKASGCQHGRGTHDCPAYSGGRGLGGPRPLPCTPAPST